MRIIHLSSHSTKSRWACLASSLVLLALAAQGASAAGNVEVIIKKGRLTIAGDDAGNSVVLRATGVSSFHFDIEGIGGTLINGQDQTLQVAGVDDFRIDLEEGDNRLLLTGEGFAVFGFPAPPSLLLPGKLSYVSGAGDDVVVVDHGHVWGKAMIHLGDGDDTVVVLNSRFAHNASLITGDGDDIVALDGLIAQGKLLVNTGHGDDAYVSYAGELDDKVKIILGSGRDVAGFIFDDFEKGAKINAGKDVDTLLHEDFEVAGHKLKGFEIETATTGQEIGDDLSGVPGIVIATELIDGLGSGLGSDSN